MACLHVAVHTLLQIPGPTFVLIDSHHLKYAHTMSCIVGQAHFTFRSHDRNYAAVLEAMI